MKRTLNGKCQQLGLFFTVLWVTVLKLLFVIGLSKWVNILRIIKARFLFIRKKFQIRTGRRPDEPCMLGWKWNYQVELTGLSERWWVERQVCTCVCICLPIMWIIWKDVQIRVYTHTHTHTRFAWPSLREGGEAPNPQTQYAHPEYRSWFLNPRRHYQPGLPGEMTAQGYGRKNTRWV